MRVSFCMIASKKYGMFYVYVLWVCLLYHSIYMVWSLLLLFWIKTTRSYFCMCTGAHTHTRDTNTHTHKHTHTHTLLPKEKAWLRLQGSHGHEWNRVFVSHTTVCGLEFTCRPDTHTHTHTRTHIPLPKQMSEGKPGFPPISTSQKKPLFLCLFIIFPPTCQYFPALVRHIFLVFSRTFAFHCVALLSFELRPLLIYKVGIV